MRAFVTTRHDSDRAGRCRSSSPPATPSASSPRPAQIRSWSTANGSVKTAMAMPTRRLLLSSKALSTERVGVQGRPRAACVRAGRRRRRQFGPASGRLFITNQCSVVWTSRRRVQLAPESRAAIGACARCAPRRVPRAERHHRHASSSRGHLPFETSRRQKRYSRISTPPLSPNTICGNITLDPRAAQVPLLPKSRNTNTVVTACAVRVSRHHSP